jgi:hypothetical protein
MASLGRRLSALGHRAQILRVGRRMRRRAFRYQQGDGDILLFCCVRNEVQRLPYFLAYYRKLGVNHFFFVDNGSSDGSDEYLANHEDVSLWTTTDSYKQSRFGMDWLNYLLGRFGPGKWCITVDPDEFFVYPRQDTRSLRELLHFCDSRRIGHMNCSLIDMYSNLPLRETIYGQEMNPIEICPWFDPCGYIETRDHATSGYWIRGGPRRRLMNAVESAPALNKTPLVKWSQSDRYISSTHSLARKRLNYPHARGLGITGALLHFKFVSTFVDKADEEQVRRQHYAGEYAAYAKSHGAGTVSLWTPESRRYTGWTSLADVGLITVGPWF